MTWFKVDDQMPHHRKTRTVRRSHASKSRDAAPFGIWALAGAWSTDGFVPLEVLEEWDDEAEVLAARLVDAGFWWETTQNGETGYGFHDWADHNPDSEPWNASQNGAYGNHDRWHVRRGIVADDCSFCRPDDRPDIAPMPENASGRIAPVPTRPVPTRPDPTLLSVEDGATGDRFEEFWRAYGKKVDRKKAQVAYRAALKKPGVTAELLIHAATEYVTWERANNQNGRYIKHPRTWLYGECWADERSTPRAQTRSEQWLDAARDLHEKRQGELA